MIYLSAGTESSTIGASIGPPPVTSYEIITMKWLSEDVYLRKYVRIKVAYLFELRSEICCVCTCIAHLLSFNRSLGY